MAAEKAEGRRKAMARVIADIENEPNFRPLDTIHVWEEVLPIYEGKPICLRDLKCFYYPGKTLQCKDCICRRDKVHRVDWKDWRQMKVAAAVQAYKLSIEDEDELLRCVYEDVSLWH